MVGSDARERWEQYCDPSIKDFHVCNETKIGRSGIAEFLWDLENNYLKLKTRVDKLSIKDLNVRSMFVIRIVNSSVAECLWHLEQLFERTYNK